MSENAKELKEKLFYKKQNGIDFMSEEELNACDEFCEKYKKFFLHTNLHMNIKYIFTNSFYHN